MLWSGGRTRVAWLLGIVMLAILLVMTSVAAAEDDDLYVPHPNQGASLQIADLTSSGNKEEARLVREMISTPQAVWFTQGTPAEVERAVRRTVKRAAAERTVPVLVAYNIPFRDCAQFSTGGATTPEEYADWIDAFATGLGDHEAIVILEPDGLGIIPWYTTIGGTLEFCQPAEANPETAAAEGFDMMSSAVERLGEQPGAAIYLDGTHGAWLGAGDTAHRLVQAGVEDADGFSSTSPTISSQTTSSPTGVGSHPVSPTSPMWNRTITWVVPISIGTEDPKEPSSPTCWDRLRVSS